MLLKRKLLLLSVLLCSLPWGVRAQDWGWSVGGGYSRLEYSHERQSSPAGFDANSFFPEFTLFKASQRRENILRIGLWNFNNWKYRDSGESAPNQKMISLLADCEQHLYLTKKETSLFRLYAGPLVGLNYRKWNLNYDGGTDLTYHWTNLRGGLVFGSLVRILPGLSADVQTNGKGMVGWYSSSPKYYANSTGIESGFELGLAAKANINLTRNIQICPGWSYIYGRDYNKRYSLILSEQRWFVSLKFTPFHAK